MAKSKLNVLIADGLGESGRKRLEAISEIELWNKSGASREELLEILPKAHVLIVRSRTQVDRALLEHGTELKLVVRAGIGLDNVDVASATDRAVVVMNAPSGNIVTTAEHTIALIFAVSRRIPQADANLRSGRWDKKKFQGNELCGKTIGIVGLGNIGKAVAQRALALGMKVVGQDPYLSPEVAAQHNIRLTSLDDLLQVADYVTVHVPLSDSTKHLINAAALEKMKDSAYLINCARGGVVDETALVAALEKKQITGCALDVFETEPVPQDHPLIHLPNVVMTPHLGASTDEAQTQVSEEVADQIIDFVEAGGLRNAINVPNVSLEQLGVLKPYLTLGERLGSFVAQLAPKSINEIEVCYEGQVSTYQRDVLTLSVLKGFLTPLVSTGVNFVNAARLLKDRGIRVVESSSQDTEDYASLIQVRLRGEETISCAGTIFGKEPRIVRIDQFKLDAVPTGVLLFTRNTDQPGVIGTIGNLLGNVGINIARMHLGLDESKGQAIAVINVDSKIAPDVVEQLRSARGMLMVRQIEL